MELPPTTGPVFTEDQHTNLYHLNELYGNVAETVSAVMQSRYGMDIPISSGIWGGTYLIAEPNGKSKRRIWRYYCIVNLPSSGPLEEHENLEKLVGVYSTTLRHAFLPEGLDLKLKMWGGRLPYTNKIKPNITMHMEDSTETVRWVRPIFVWNTATWEQSIIYDTLRLVKELKQNLHRDREPPLKDPQQIKYLLQDIIILYKTLEQAHDPDFIEHAEGIIKDMTQAFLRGLSEEDEILDWYHKVHQYLLIYGYEQTLEMHYQPYRLDVRAMEQWPVEKINFVPDELQAKLIPPIQDIFATFRQNLNNHSG
ncbi:hypothetical protein NITGR_20004 [Nitrospina gracilis 3/211]|uniref:Uncharacterized protein n=1 Tax=Nitrospina gracilis (strain 3/211) TaxID=1266370 RepID=M1YWU4_NITG3|nr:MULTISPECIES: hypothetical protein [Nitrospina]MCF8722357.1 hypothetical protein [Nitrospina sp. Nb-3]CCQ89969.1 hypothetical protein NITGR_20004 [Nitrospina gracilis 3/211]